MPILISKESEVPLRQQLAEQIVFRIATGKLHPGESLPSVRELARRLKIHHNTVSEAYQDLIRRKWLEGKRGRRVTVRAVDTGGPSGTAGSLDELINTLIRVARERAIPSSRCGNGCANDCLPSLPITFWWWKRTKGFVAC